MRIACGHVGIDPIRDSRDLLLRERRIVRKMSAARICKPGRHTPGTHVIANPP